jgi:hypothetical protein
LLFEKRNITIHRTSPSVRGEIQATTTEKISISESVSVIVPDKDRNIKQRSNMKENKEEHTEPSERTISTKWFFEDYPQREVPDVCHSLLEKMKDFAKKSTKSSLASIQQNKKSSKLYTKNAGVSLGMSKCLWH